MLQTPNTMNILKFPLAVSNYGKSFIFSSQNNGLLMDNVGKDCRRNIDNSLYILPIFEAKQN